MKAGLSEPAVPGSSTTAAVREALARAGAESPLDACDAETLLGARGEVLSQLLEWAGQVRDEGLRRVGRQGVVTYSRKVFLPLTRLCRDRCHYCVFAKTPGELRRDGQAPYMSPEEVLRIARRGAELGCKEALLTLGDRPEHRWTVAREWLDAHGYSSTLEYVADMARLVLAETGLLPHLNPGVMTWAELQSLRPYAPSMGMMLETTATTLWSEPGGPHFGSPDKNPALRLAVIEDAGRSRIPFTTGVLFGIGETDRERVEALIALRDAHERHSHIQEVIVQNFRAKQGTAMLAEPDLGLEEYVAAVAVARLILGPDMRLQAPPNLTDPRELDLLLRAGIDDWGGVSPLTPDHVNPERPWPHLEELAALSQGAGFELRERLTAHPAYICLADSGRDPKEWIDDRLLPAVLRHADSDGLARYDVLRTASVEGPRAVVGSGAGIDRGFAALLAKAAVDPAGLDNLEYVKLLHAEGGELEALVELADDVRARVAGPEITFVVNRNLDTSRGLSPAHIGELAEEAVGLGATEICAQGAVPVEQGVAGYLDVPRSVKAVAPTLHLHGFRPVELKDGAERAGMSVASWIRLLRRAGLDTSPGTGARILDDKVRGALTRGADIPAAEWVRLVIAAHTQGLRTTATMVYGHVETKLDQVHHLRTLARIQDLTGGFTEFIPMPWQPLDTPYVVPGARSGPSLRETRAVYAVARLMLMGRIDHIQAAWPKLGLRGAQLVLAGGADDLGGFLLDGVIDPAAGQEAGRQLSRSAAERVATDLGRPLRQRTTTYARV